MSDQRPKGRERKVTGSGAGTVFRRGEGLGSGPVGSRPGKNASGGTWGNRPQMKRPGAQSPGSGAGFSGSFRYGAGQGGMSRGAVRAGRRGLPLIAVVMIVYFLARALLSAEGDPAGTQGQNGGMESVTVQTPAQSGLSSSSGGYSGLFTGNASVSSGWESEAPQVLSTTVAGGAREKYTTLVGGGEDKVTILVYMCGTDLERKSGMATADISEMAKASISDQMNLLVYTGGCRSWRNTFISSEVNQIYQVKSGGVTRLVEDAGSGAMTDPGTLASFIQYGAQQFPANRLMLIFWDHGGGSVSGFGYDEKYENRGAMTLTEIDQALSAVGVKFDLIGFDTCLMGTAENALMLSEHADYLVASEETEPGNGWYYTPWLNALSEDPSLPTTELGKRIIDSYIEECARRCPSQPCTLSLTDLAELQATLPERLRAFGEAISGEINKNNYKAVSKARANTREFSVRSRIDQVDLAHLGYNLGNSEGKRLAEALRSAVKYNRTSSNMTNAYGLSMYFPYQRASYVDRVTKTYGEIGIDESYTKCIREFAALETTGQIAAGGSTGSYTSLLGSLIPGSSTDHSSGGSAELISSMLESFLGGSASYVDGLTPESLGFFQDRSLSNDQMARYVSQHYFDEASLVFSENESGDRVMRLSKDQWDLVTGLELNMFYDDGEGFIDLGLDNVYDFDKEGNLLCDTTNSWLAVGGQIVAYYHESTVASGDTYTITGRTPVLIDGERADLIIVFDTQHPYGYVAGVRYVYDEALTLTAGKSAMEILEDGSVSYLRDGVRIDFLCDYYSYNGSYTDSYMLGEPLFVRGELTVSNLSLPEENLVISYLFTDIYQQHYWSEGVRP